MHSSRKVLYLKVPTRDPGEEESQASDFVTSFRQHREHMRRAAPGPFAFVPGSSPPPHVTVFSESVSR